MPEHFISRVFGDRGDRSVLSNARQHSHEQFCDHCRMGGVAFFILFLASLVRLRLHL